MRLYELFEDWMDPPAIVAEDGRIVRGVNTTCDVDTDETKVQAAKYGNDVDADGYPPLIYNISRTSR